MVETQNWTSEFSLAFKNLASLYSFLEWEMNPALSDVAKKYPLFVPRKLASKIKVQGKNGVLARQFLPDELELDQDLNKWGLEDPIGDKKYHMAPQLIHRYSTRALFTATTICPVHCRYCFRKNELNTQDVIFSQEFSETLRYLQNHPEISEIIFTGGDPFTLSNEKIDRYLRAFSKVQSIKDVRFHTRYPVILPERFDPELIQLLEDHSTNFRTVSIAIHANHLDEFDKDTDACIKRLSSTKVQLLSQTVLLSGVNDELNSLLELFNHFLELKIRPYYLHHPDRVKGGMHFHLPLERGRAIYHALRDKLPGWAIPNYVIDLPEGHGKISAFNPENLSFSGTLLSREGTSVSIPHLND